MKKNFNIKDEFKTNSTLTPTVSKNVSVKRQASDIINRAVSQNDDAGSHVVSSSVSLVRNSKHTVDFTNSVLKYGAVRSVKMANVSSDFVVTAKNKIDAFGKTFSVSSKPLAKTIARVDERTFERIKNQSYKAKAKARFKEINTKKFSKYTVRKGLVDGYATTNISFSKLKGNINSKFKNITIKNAYKGIKKTTVFAVSNSARNLVSLKNGVITSSLKIASKGARNLEDVVLTSDNLGTQSVAVGLKSVRLSKATIESIKVGSAKTAASTKRSVKFGVNTAKGVRKFVQFSKTSGLKSASYAAYDGAISLLNKAGGSVVNILIGGFKSLATKFIVPIIAIVVLSFMLMQAITTPVVGISSIFSGSVSEKDSKEDIEINEYLTKLVMEKRSDFVLQIKEIRNSNDVANGGEYSIIKLFNMYDINEVELTDTNVLSSIYSTTQYVELVEPIFAAIMLTEYDLEPTKSQMNQIFNEMWDVVNTVELEELPSEIVCQTYGNGIEYTDDFHTSTKEETTICEEKKVLAINISVGGFDSLIRKYYTDEIAGLENRSNLTKEEKDRLDVLKDNYEFCMAYMETIDSELSIGGAVVVEIDDITLVPITELAANFIGNPYIYGGNDINNGIDCSAYTQYLYKQFGINLPRTASEQALYGETVLGVQNALPGDLFFYSEDGTNDGIYHVSMYLGNNKVIHASNSKPYPAGGVKVSNMFGNVYQIKRYIQ